MENVTTNYSPEVPIQGSTIEERMEERLALLTQDFETKLPFLFESQNKLVFSHHMNHSEVTIPLTKQLMAEDLTDILATRLNTHILYADRTLDNKKYRIIGFSKPTREKMYIFFVNSLMYGVVEEVTFDFYESMDYMLMRLFDILFSLEEEQKKTKQFFLLEKLSMNEIQDIFCI